VNPLQIHPRFGGVIGVLLGIACIAYTFYTAINKGYFYKVVCIAGPVMIPISLGFVILPSRYLQKPHEWNTVVDRSKFNPTSLGKYLLGMGVVLSIGFYIYMRNGF